MNIDLSSLSSPTLKELPEKFILRFDIFPIDFRSLDKTKYTLKYNYIFEIKFDQKTSYYVHLYFQHFPMKYTNQIYRENYESFMKKKSLSSFQKSISTKFPSKEVTQDSNTNLINYFYQGVINEKVPFQCDTKELYILKQYSPIFIYPSSFNDKFNSHYNYSQIKEYKSENMDARLFFFLNYFYKVLIDKISFLKHEISTLSFTKPDFILLNIPDPILNIDTTQTNSKIVIENIQLRLTQMNALSYIFYPFQNRLYNTLYLFLDEKVKNDKSLMKPFNIGRNLVQIIPYQYYNLNYIKENSVLIPKDSVQNLNQIFQCENVICILNEGLDYRIVFENSTNNKIKENLSRLKVKNQIIQDVYKIQILLPNNLEPMSVFELFSAYSPLSIQPDESGNFILYVSGKDNAKQIIQDFPSLTNKKCNKPLIFNMPDKKGLFESFNSYDSASSNRIRPKSQPSIEKNKKDREKLQIIKDQMSDIKEDKTGYPSFSSYDSASSNRMRPKSVPSVEKK